MRQKIIDLAQLKKHSYQDIGNMVGCSRQYVQQVLKSEDIDVAWSKEATKLNYLRQMYGEAVELVKRRYYNGESLKDAEKAVGVKRYILNRLWKRDKTDLDKHIQAKFWAKIEKTDGCWNWTGYIAPNGMPHTSTIRGVNRPQVIVWTLTKGKPKNYISATCDNKLCCNPDHLADVTFDKVIEKRKRTYEREPERMPCRKKKETTKDTQEWTHNLECEKCGRVYCDHDSKY